MRPSFDPTEPANDTAHANDALGGDGRGRDASSDSAFIDNELR